MGAIIAWYAYKEHKEKKKLQEANRQSQVQTPGVIQHSPVGPDGKHVANLDAPPEESDFQQGYATGYRDALKHAAQGHSLEKAHVK